MTVRKPALALFSWFCIVQLVKHTNGETTPPWITFLGCVDIQRGFSTRMFANNTATNCFMECANFAYVGIEANNCICIKEIQNMTFRPETQCKRGDPLYMRLYSKVTNTTFQDADYGHVYVKLSSPSSYEFHTSRNPSDTHRFICYPAYLKACTYGSLNEKTTWSLAWDRCQLVSYFDFKSCQGTFETGEFWIEMYRESAGFTTVSQTPRITTQFSTSTPSAVSTSTPTLPAAVSLTMNTKSSSLNPMPTGSTLYTENTTSKAIPEDRWKNIAIAFVVLCCVLLFVVIPGMVVFLRYKKDTHIRHDNVEERPDLRTVAPSPQDPKFPQDKVDTTIPSEPVPPIILISEQGKLVQLSTPPKKKKKKRKKSRRKHHKTNNEEDEKTERRKKNKQRHADAT